MRKNGFTLIEVLLVIVILAIIAIIARPTILNIIEDTKIKAAIQSAYGYVDAVNVKISISKATSNKILDNTYDIIENDLGVKYSGTKPSKGIVTVLNSKVDNADLCINGYPIEYSNKVAVYNANSDICPRPYKFVEPEGTVIADLCNGGTYEVGSYKIKTVEDLVCFGKLVDEGNNFSGSTVMLLSDLDIKDKSTYKDASKLASYDINENGTIESIYTELTTEAGFNPIGSSTTASRFAGTFEGYGFYINNLYIKRKNYIGLFAYNTGTIQGLNMNNVDITTTASSSATYAYTGGLVGYNTGTINEINLSGKVIGSTAGAFYVGGIVGYNDSGTVKNVLSNAEVQGYRLIGGLSGDNEGTSSAKGTLSGIMEGGSVTGYSNVARITGGYEYNESSTTGYALSTITVNRTESGSYSANGTSYTENNISMYEQILDTYVGGDNDSSGYYFDYDETGEFVVKSTAREPIKNTLDGSGTENDPYIIKSIDDWKIATATVKEGYYYELASDLDFKDEYFYPMGSSTNYFTGHLNGNGYTIKNVSLHKYSYGGIVGYNTGTIEGINFDNIVITGGTNLGIIGYNTGSVIGINATNTATSGESYIGGLVGYNTGIINEINISGDVIGTDSYIGGTVGYNKRTSDTLGSMTNILVNMNVSGKTYVGAMGGYSTSYSKSDLAIVKGIVEGGSVTGTGGSGYEVSKTVGYISTSYNTRNIFTISSLTITNEGENKYAGTSYTTNSVNQYDAILDTYIGGDNDSSGYYFDYDETGEFVIKSVEKHPIKNTLDGSGTENDPYIIKSTDDWKIATATVKEGVYYKLVSDLDFSDEYFYPMGTGVNYFTGYLNGNGYTIKNISTSGYNYSGIFGYSTGSIEGINFENINILIDGSYVGLIGYSTGTIKGINATNIKLEGNDYTAGVVGYSTGVIQSINATNMNVSGTKYVGGVTGYISGSINEINISGSVTGTGEYVGGIAGYIKSGYIKNTLLNIDVTGTQRLGGVLGTLNSSNKPSAVFGIVEGGSINGTKTSLVGKISGASGFSMVTGYVSSDVTLAGSGGYSGTSFDSSYYNDLAYYNSVGLETSYTGDSNNTGYYFDYNDSGDDIVLVKVGSTSSGTSVSATNNSYIAGTTDTTAPICTLNYVTALSNGFSASFTCTDDTEIESIRSLFDSALYQGDYDSSTFEKVGTVKNGSFTNSNKTVSYITKWTTSNSVDNPPQKGVCYYFSYAVKDTSGNYNIYHTDKCLSF